MSYSKTGSWDASEELTQETFLVAYANLAQLKQPPPVGLGIDVDDSPSSNLYRLAHVMAYTMRLCWEGLLEVWDSLSPDNATGARLDNVCAMLDNNGLQIDGRLRDVMSPAPIPDKWRAFGWNVIEIDGHDMAQILNALDAAEEVRGLPTIIIGRTIKGKGVSFMEDKKEYHGAAPTAVEYEQAMKELCDV